MNELIQTKCKKCTAPLGTDDTLFCITHRMQWQEHCQVNKLHEQTLIEQTKHLETFTKQ